MSKKNEQNNGEAVVQKVFTDLEEAKQNPRHGKTKEGEVREWDLFCIEVTRDIAAGTKVYVWSGGNGVAQVIGTNELGVKTNVVGSRRGSSGTITKADILSAFDRLPEEEKEALLKEQRDKLAAAKKAEKAAAKKAGTKHQEPVEV